MTERSVANVTCLGCGCACDDITVVVKKDRITEARNTCALGAAWFGDGTVPAEAHVNGRTEIASEAQRRMRWAGTAFLAMTIGLSSRGAAAT